MPRPPLRPRETFMCVEPFAIFRGGVPEVYGANRMVLADDPVLRSHPAHFVPVADRVEAMTASPGEFRPIRVPVPPETQPALDVPAVIETKEADNG